jgi:hypothetical protein
MATVKKIYCDSRFAEGNGSSFSIELPETVNCSVDCVAWITDVSFPVAWHTIDIHNDKVFLLEQQSPDIDWHARVVQIPKKDYTLGSDLVTQLKTALNTSGANAATKTVAGTYDVSFSQATFSLTVTLSGGGTFSILSFDQLRDSYFWTRWRYYATQDVNVLADPHVSYLYERFNPKTANGVLRIGLGEGSHVTLGTTQVGGSLDLRPVHTIYLCSETLSDYKVLGPTGGLRSTLRRIAITEPSKGLQYSEHSGHSEDYVSVGNQSLKTLLFSLKDSYGNVVTLNGGHCSFSILFGERPGA